MDVCLLICLLSARVQNKLAWWYPAFSYSFEMHKGPLPFGVFHLWSIPVLWCSVVVLNLRVI
jgi:hypothetical protein